MWFKGNFSIRKIRYQTLDYGAQRFAKFLQSFAAWDIARVPTAQGVFSFTSGLVIFSSFILETSPFPVMKR